MPPPASTDEGYRGWRPWNRMLHTHMAGGSAREQGMQGPQLWAPEWAMRDSPGAITVASTHGSCPPELCESEYYFPAPGVWSGSQQPQDTQAPSSALTQREMSFPHKNAAWFLGWQSSLCQGLSEHPMSSLHRNHPGVSPCSYLVVI